MAEIATDDKGEQLKATQEALAEVLATRDRERREASQRIEALGQALQKYGRHRITCDWEKGHCDCGLIEAPR